MEIEKLVPDTSVIIENLVSQRLEKKEIKTKEILIHEAVLAELEHQANLGKEIGRFGLDELKNLRELAKKLKFEIKYTGRRPNVYEIRNASSGEIDALIRDLAYNEDAFLLTGDKVQSKVAEAKGIKVIYIEPVIKAKKLKIEKFFDERTMSVHLRENYKPYAKRGMPGSWETVFLDDKNLSQEELIEFSRNIIEEAKTRKEGFIEIERRGSSIVQIENFRIVITRPPFSDAYEITAVRPIKKLNIEDYGLSDKLKRRIENQAEGILIAGSPGQGKCLDGEEIVYTDNFEPIKVKDFYSKNKNIVYSINKHGKFSKDMIISKTKRIENKLFEIKTKTGRSIKVSEDHPLLTFKDEIKWVSAKNLNIKDTIAVSRHIKLDEDDNFDFLKFYDPKITFCEIEKTDKDIPIYYKYLNTKRGILHFIYIKNYSNNKEISKYLKISLKHTRILLNELEDEGILYKKDKNYFVKRKDFNLRNYNFLLLKDIDELNIDRNLIIKIEVLNSKYKNKFNFIKIPKKIDSNICKFFGYILSEGGGDKLSFTNTNQGLIEDFKLSAYCAFEIDKWKGCGYTNYIDWRTAIEPILTNCGYLINGRKKSRNMHLPSFLNNCNLENLKDFIRAYFDGDGGVDINSRIIDFYTSSEKTANQLVILLLRLNIYSHITKKYRKGADRFTIRIFDLKSIKNFLNNIKPLSKDKAMKLEECLNKKYSQTITYNIHPLINKIKKYIKLKIKPEISIDRVNIILDRLYRIYYDYSSNNESALYILKEYINNLEEVNKIFNENKNKLTYSILRKNSMDHNCIKHWNNERKIKISTLNKVVSVLNYNSGVSPMLISNILRNTLESSGASVSQISKEIGINESTMQLRVNNGWNTDIEHLKKTYNSINLYVFNTKKEMELAINSLKIIGNSDILFDEITQINKITGNFEVYDFETKNHNFFCGTLPLIVHNSTCASALAEFYALTGKTVKTIEAPRDLQLKDNITQYAISHGTSDEIHDVLLLSRPDYVIYDEMRNINDFRLFADLRLSGIGLAGVIHATNPVDSIQRFIGKMELGVIPQIVDTVVFIKNGKVWKVLSLTMIVKVPSGMTEADLARPIVEIRDFETNKLEYEVYSYGEETVVIPVQDEKKAPIKELASRHIEYELQREIPGIKAELISDNRAVIYVPENEIGKVIGKNGERISEIERRLGVSIDVQSLDENRKELKYNLSEKGNALFFYVNSSLSNKEVDFHGKEGFLFSARVGKKGEIKIKKRSKMADRLLKMLNRNEKITIKI